MMECTPCVPTVRACPWEGGGGGLRLGSLQAAPETDLGAQLVGDALR